MQIGRFHSLHVLEVKKVPIHMVEGLSKLRGQLREIIITRSLQKLQVLKLFLFYMMVVSNNCCFYASLSAYMDFMLLLC